MAFLCYFATEINYNKKYYDSSRIKIGFRVGLWKSS